MTDPGQNRCHTAAPNLLLLGSLLSALLLASSAAPTGESARIRLPAWHPRAQHVHSHAGSRAAGTPAPPSRAREGGELWGSMKAASKWLTSGLFPESRLTDQLRQKQKAEYLRRRAQQGNESLEGAEGDTSAPWWRPCSTPAPEDDPCRYWWEMRREAGWTPGGCGRERRDVPVCDEIWWSPALLDRAIAVPSFAQAWPFLDKLQAGLPVTVVAFGSSLTEGFGGVFHSSSEQLQAAVQIPPGVYLTGPSLSVGAGGGPGEGEGWLRQFMAALNATWPHPQHLLVNEGRSAAAVDFFAKVACLESHLPRAADLVVVESLGHLRQRGADLEALVERVWQHLQAHGQPRRPPVLLLHSGKWFEKVHKVQADGRRIAKAAHCPLHESRHGSFKPDPKCRTAQERMAHRSACLEMHTLSRDSFGNHTAEDRFTLVARTRHLASLSLRDLFWAAFRAGLPRAMGVSQCELVGSVFRDPFHPWGRRAGGRNRGMRLLADVLLHYLGAALAARPPPGERAGYGSEGEGGWGAAEGEARPLRLHRCYAFDQELQAQLENEQGMRRGGGLAGQRQQAGDPGTGAAADRATQGEGTATQATILSSSGWRFVVDGRSGGEVMRYAPGWVGERPGDELALQVSSVFRQLAPEQNATLEVYYLESYERMGRASIRCLSGCTCEGDEVDAYSPTKQSVTRTHRVAVSQHARCVVGIRIMEGSSTKHHRFKITMLAIAFADRDFLGTSVFSQYIGG